MSDRDQAISEDILLPPSPQPVKSAPAEAPGPVEQGPASPAGPAWVLLSVSQLH